MPRLLLSLAGLILAGQLVAQDLRVSFAEPVSIAGYASGVALEWRVFDDRGVDYYAVLRRLDGVERAVSTVDPKREAFEHPLAYRYIDATPFRPDLAYRLRVVFADGSYADSDWLSAGRAHGTRTRILSALDEESLARLHISLDSKDHHGVTVRIKTLRGVEIDSYERDVAAGVNVLEIDYESWPSGYYTVQIDDAADVMEWLVHVDAGVPKASTRRLSPKR